jgi:hypothetical protein
MPLPDRLYELARAPHFWSDYFGDDVFGSEWTGLPKDPFVTLPLGPNYSVRVGITDPFQSSPYVSASQLRLRREADGKEWLLAWRYDDGHMHPNVLRWEEVDLIGRVQAVLDPKARHPGIPFMLLEPYVAPVDGTDRALGLGLLDDALRTIDGFNEAQIRYYLFSSNPPRSTFEWRKDKIVGWHLHFLGYAQPGDDVASHHSLRCLPKKSVDSPWAFPFAEWQDALSDAESVFTNNVPHPVEWSTRRVVNLPKRTHVELRYQCTKSEAALKSYCSVKQALYDAGLGRGYLLGSWSAFENVANPHTDISHPDRDDEFILKCYGKFDEIVSLIRRVVADAGNPDVRLYQYLFRNSPPYYSRIPLGSESATV